MADRPITHEEGSKGGDRSILVWAIVSALMMGWIVVTGLQGRKPVAVTTPQPTTEAPATSGAQTPQ
jgi:hypothetical protein